MSSAVNVLICACYPQALEKVPRVDNVGSLGPIPMIQQPFNMSLEPCFSIQRFQSYTLFKLVRKLHFQYVILSTKD